MESGKYYHIYNRGVNKSNIFFEQTNYYYFLNRFHQYLGKYVKVLAYCLMPNHFHFFILINEDDEVTSKNGKPISLLEKAFRDFFISYAKGINKRYKRTGSLFQYKFKRKEIQDEGHFTWLIYYIHMNPVKAGIYKSLKEYRYSSFNALITNKPTKVARANVLEWFGGKGALEEFHEETKKEFADLKFGFNE